MRAGTVAAVGFKCHEVVVLSSNPCWPDPLAPTVELNCLILYDVCKDARYNACFEGTRLHDSVVRGLAVQHL
jgi:hypothetical protein